MTVDATDKAVNGCLIKTITPSGAVGKDGRLCVGDYVISVNNESMRHITNAQARAILRRASLLGTDIRCPGPAMQLPYLSVTIRLPVTFQYVKFLGP